jgi:hypothetical protein
MLIFEDYYHKKLEEEDPKVSRRNEIIESRN